MKDISKNYITIQGWMPQALDLKGNELIAYGLIFAFCQDQQSEFTGSIQYLSTWMNCSKPTTLKAINGLIKRELIIKYQDSKNGIVFNRFKINFNKLNSILDGGYRNFTPSKETLPPVKKLNRGSKESLQGGSKESLPNKDILDKDKFYKDKDSLKDDFQFLFSSPSFSELYIDFLEMRKELKAKNTKRSETIILKKIEKLSEGKIENAILLLEQSIENSWKGIFALKNNTSFPYGKNSGGESKSLLEHNTKIAENVAEKLSKIDFDKLREEQKKLDPFA